MFQEESVIFEKMLLRLDYIEIKKYLYLELNGFGNKF